MKEEIVNTKNSAISQVLSARSVLELEEIRINFLGKNGRLTKLIKKLQELPKTQRRELGILINDSKNSLIAAIATQKRKLEEDSREWFDPTVPGKKPPVGHLHLITQAIEEISLIFERIGFVRVRYPEVEWDWFAFGSLNFGEYHPARDDWETFIVEQKPHPKYGQMILSPHTSSGQVREMWRVKKPPIRMINIAKCYRRQSDASHYPMFHQFEGLVVDKDISIANLKGTLNYFAKEFYGLGAVSRIRPYNFPFTEPSFEVDFTCTVCKGKSRLPDGQVCKLCKEGWLEIGGAGMVHPNVLKAGGIDPKVFSGFAFGWGVERALMMKPGLGIPDIRILYSSDIRYLRQF